MLVDDKNEEMSLDRRNMIASVGLAEFEEKVLNETMPVLLLCMHQDYEFQEQMRSIEDIYRTCAAIVKMYLLDDEALRTFKERFAVKGTPTFLLFVKGRERGRILGWVDCRDLTDFLSRMLQL